MNREMLVALAEPFPPESIGQKPTIWCRACDLRECVVHSATPCEVCGDTITTAHDHLDFVGHAYVRERLNQVDPDWNWRPVATDAHGLPLFDDNRGLWIALTVGGKTMLGYGDAPTARRGNAIKECIGDALRNAGQSFGIALDQWKRARRLRVVESVDDQPDTVTDERAAKRLREEIQRLGHRKGRKFIALLHEFEKWANGKAEWATADAATLTAFKDYLKAA